MPYEDAAIYEMFIAAILETLRPAGAAEKTLARSIADGRWRLNRARAIEQNVFALGEVTNPETLDANLEVNAALVQAQTFLQNVQQIQLLTLYEGHIDRLVRKYSAELKELQTARLAAHQKALEAAILLYQLSKANEQSGLIPTNAESEANINGQSDGFGFSKVFLNRHIDRQRVSKKPEATQTARSARPPEAKRMANLLQIPLKIQSALVLRTASWLAPASFALFCASFCVGTAKAADPDATAALQRGDFPAAELKLRADLKAHPRDAETLSLLAFALDSQNKFPQADPLHRQAIAAAPRSTPVLGRYGNHLLATGDEKNARNVFQSILAIDPADRYANLQLAQLALKFKDAAHAKEALLYLDHIPPAQGDAQRDMPDAALQRLVALDLTGDPTAADAIFIRLTSATEKNPALSASLGWKLAEYGEYNRAEPLLTQALAADPANFHVLYDLGVVALYAGHYARAHDVLETAVRQQPDNVDALYSLAFVYSALKQPEPTLRYAAHAAQLAPKRADVQRLVAVTAGELQANQDAADAWDRYAALAPGDDTARRERGFARIHLRQFDTGIADLEWYIARHPRDPTGHYELGLAQSTSDPTKGLASLDRALELQPDFIAARAARGALYYVQGKPETALPDLEAAAAAEPSNGVILDRLGQAYRALDRLADAIRVLRQAAALAPAEATIQLHLANALAEAGENAESEALTARYRQQRPTQAPRDLMRYLSLTPELQRADYRARVEKAVHDNPTDAAAQLLYLKLSLEAGRMAEGAATARTIAGLKPGASVLADAGRAMLAARQYRAAKDLLEQAAALDPAAGVELDLAIAAFHNSGAAAGLRLMALVPESRQNASFYLARAQMLSASGKTEEAMASLDRAAPMLPDDSQLPLIRATLLEAGGKTEDARQLLDQIQRRWPEDGAVWVARGISLSAHGQFAEARKALQTAVSLGAHSPEAWYYLADATLRSAPDRMAEADAAIHEALKLAPEDASIKALASAIARKTGPLADRPNPFILFRTRAPREW